MPANEDVVRIMCPNLGCQRVLAVPSAARGKVVRCRGCGSNIRIPALRTDGAAGHPPSNGQQPPQKKAG
ncbi:MAG: hypothetical protein NTU45_08665 [Planctomycetota bacterium]|jgi:hypothetical protein|nr:hypothetical protein [Planctomycetota bacterium]